MEQIREILRLETMVLLFAALGVVFVAMSAAHVVFSSHPVERGFFLFAGVMVAFTTWRFFARALWELRRDEWMADFRARHLSAD